MEYVARFLNCQQVKYEHQRPGDLLQQMPILERKWEHITMDFVVGLPRTLRKFDAVWVIVDRLTKLAHFIPVVSTYTSERLAQIYIREIDWLHGVPVSIISDRGPQFTSHFRRAVQNFVYDNNYQSSIEMDPFEALYSRRCRSPIWYFEPGKAKLYGKDLVQDALEKVKLIYERLRTAQSRQKSYVDQKAYDVSFMVGEKGFWMLENVVKAKVHYAVLTPAMRNNPVVGQMAGYCSEDNTRVDYVEPGDVHRFGIEVESV
ncbi:uncharacterized protein [Nicotiana sylvestris]|uniref:uncharacterized protein n=1 Tax=Nicotiana sylvestris TaxID=4096 RepID=UPI00388C48A0